MNKPLNGPIYGSTPHLMGSLLGPGDHHIHPAHHEIFTKKELKDSIVFVQEKLDGTCVGVYKSPIGLMALNRRGYDLSSNAPTEDQALFYKFVMHNRDKFNDVLKEGELLVGEWLYKARGTQYDIRCEPFFPFDCFNMTMVRGVLCRVRSENTLSFYQRFGDIFSLPFLVSAGSAIEIAEAFDFLKSGTGKFIWPVEGEPEGLIYRLENDGNLMMKAKWVRPDYEPLKFAKDPKIFITNHIIYS
jgi:hypothetical protein